MADTEIAMILQAQQATIGYLSDALKKLSQIQGLEWDTEKQDWVRCEYRSVENG